MTLQEGEYQIPDGCIVKRDGNAIRIYKPKQIKLMQGEYRCKDCIHYVKGYSMASTWFQTNVCELKPKYIQKRKDRAHFKAAKKYDKICDKFELKVK